MKKITVIIPFLNEEENLKLAEELLYKPLSVTDFSYEILFVNDGGTDGSEEVLKKIDTVNYPNIESRIIRLSKNFGSHAAIFSGITNSTGDYVTILSGDFQDNASVIGKMYEESQKGFDIIFPLREVSGQNIFVRLFSNLYASLIRKIAIRNYPNKNFDLFFINRKVADHVIETYEINTSLFLDIMNIGFRQSYIHYERENRKSGKSKWTFSKKLKLMTDSVIGFSYTPIRLVTLTGFILLMTGIVWSLIIVMRKIFFNDIAQGWTLMSSILFLGFGITNLSLGIIAEYLWRTLDAARNRPLYIIDEIVELNKDKKSGIESEK
ncbi:MAG TPA: glycosyltransferase [Ignavibacteria bacterium]|nr:glycosyltransferase [Ignavibacteria bacterium]